MTTPFADVDRHRHLLSFALAMMACSGASTPAPLPIANTAPAPPVDARPPSESELAMRALETFAKEMCSCADAECANRVSAKMMEWAKERVNQDAELLPKLTQDEEKRATDIGMRLSECMQRAMPPAGP